MVGIGVVQAGGKLVFAGGTTCSGVSDHADIYDPATDQWSTSKLSRARTLVSAIGSGSTAVFAGGLQPQRDFPFGLASDAVDIYDADSGRWSSAHLTEPRVNLAAAVVGNQVLLAGGERPPEVEHFRFLASATIDVFGLASGAWTVDRLSKARAGAQVVSLGTPAAFVGGVVDFARSVDLDSVDVIDIFGGGTITPHAPASR